MLRILPLADGVILPQAKQESYFFNRIGQEQSLTGGRVSFGLPSQYQYRGLPRLLPIKIAGAAAFAGPAALVFAYNAGFDRCFAKRLSRIFTTKPRERTMLQLDWAG